MDHLVDSLMKIVAKYVN